MKTDAVGMRRSLPFLLVVVCLMLPACGKETPREEAPNPSTYSTPLWDQLLGGDQGFTNDTWLTLSDPGQSDLGVEDAEAVAGLARSIVVSTQTGKGRDQHGDYFAGVTGPGSCDELSVLGAGAALLPTSEDPGQYAKALVAWTGKGCDGVDPAEEAVGQPQVSYVYAKRTGKTWGPVHEWDVPGSTTLGGTDASANQVPPDWEMKNFSSCGDQGNAEFRDLIVVVEVFEAMCQDAGKDGVRLKIESGFRTPEEQAKIFQAAIKYYGSEAEARKYVAFSDGNVCASRHCAGAAVNVSPDNKAHLWLHAIVGCLRSSQYVEASSCSEGVAISRLQRYGFSAPIASNRSYLEYALPLTPSLDNQGSCVTPASTSIPEAVGKIFRCRLASHGIVGARQDQIVAEALVVSRCESNWVPDARLAGGRFAKSPYPLNGQLYTQVGVFMISEPLAQRWVPGGAAALTDPVANINGAASLWLAGESWGPWPCATGADSPFESGPVLPQFGGPALPDWAKGY